MKPTLIFSKITGKNTYSSESNNFQVLTVDMRFHINT